MSTAHIKAAFVSELGSYGTCAACTMQYIDEGKEQLLRFYVRRAGQPEEVIEAIVPRGASLLGAAREKAKEVRNAQSQAGPHSGASASMAKPSGKVSQAG